ncbi:hypothetical protein TSUD_161730 [Trifolium subterraneum]|uniref:Uncharacterized protein n=1 Tax=Trifolium subterraneum TaxID=3900 RepID=A0A2Z6MDA9_TRISU|nr:hypothetical protein TSUD_161730 [Trifolium subterraneum]
MFSFPFWGGSSQRLSCLLSLESVEVEVRGQFRRRRRSKVVVMSGVVVVTEL